MRWCIYIYNITKDFARCAVGGRGGWMGGARWKVKDTSTYQPNNCPSGIVKVRLSVFFYYWFPFIFDVGVGGGLLVFGWGRFVFDVVDAFRFTSEWM